MMSTLCPGLGAFVAQLFLGRTAKLSLPAKTPLHAWPMWTLRVAGLTMSEAPLRTTGAGRAAICLGGSACALRILPTAP
jgi:hypothetical protein